MICIHIYTIILLYIIIYTIIYIYILLYYYILLYILLYTIILYIYIYILYIYYYILLYAGLCEASRVLHCFCRSRNGRSLRVSASHFQSLLIRDQNSMCTRMQNDLCILINIFRRRRIIRRQILGTMR